MTFKNTHSWTRILLWVGVVLALLVLGYALWYSYFDIAVTAVIVMIVFLLLLAYIKYLQIMTLRRRFVIVQETFTTVMLVYFSYAYFAGSRTLPGYKQIENARQKWDAVYEKSRYHLTLPLIMTTLKTFGEIKNIKDIIMSEVKNFATTDGFNLDNAETITKEVGALVQKLGQLSDIVGKGFAKSPSFAEIMKPEKEADKAAPKKRVQTADKKKSERAKK